MENVERSTGKTSPSDDKQPSCCRRRAVAAPIMVTRNEASLRYGAFGALLAEEAELARHVARDRYDDDGGGVGPEILLRLIGVRTALIEAIYWACQADARDALGAGATWQEIAEAQGVSQLQARTDFLRWTDVQGTLWESTRFLRSGRLGLSPSQRREAYDRSAEDF